MGCENKLKNTGHSDYFSQAWFGMDDENVNFGSVPIRIALLL